VGESTARRKTRRGRLPGPLSGRTPGVPGPRAGLSRQSSVSVRWGPALILPQLTAVTVSSLAESTVTDFAGRRPQSDVMSTGMNGLRVLLVEDCAALRDALRLLLEADGAHVIAVGTGQDALEAAARNQFEVVLSDLGLPDIPGDLLIRRLTAITTPGTKIFAMTGFDAGHVARARAEGAEAVLLKPFDWELVRALIHEPRAAA
jgi:CheY-like chemotaxis protein